MTFRHEKQIRVPVRQQEADAHGENIGQDQDGAHPSLRGYKDKDQRADRIIEGARLNAAFPHKNKRHQYQEHPECTKNRTRLYMPRAEGYQNRQTVKRKHDGKKEQPEQIEIHDADDDYPDQNRQHTDRRKQPVPALIRIPRRVLQFCEPVLPVTHSVSPGSII